MQIAGNLKNESAAQRGQNLEDKMAAFVTFPVASFGSAALIPGMTFRLTC